MILLMVNNFSFSSLTCKSTKRYFYELQFIIPTRKRKEKGREGMLEIGKKIGRGEKEREGEGQTE